MLNHIVVPLLIVVSGFICLEFFVPIAIGELMAGIIGGLILDLKQTPWLEFLSQLGRSGIDQKQNLVKLPAHPLRRGLRAHFGHRR